MNPHPQKRSWKPLLALAAMLLLGVCQQVQAQAFTCDSTLYLSQTGTDGQLYTVNRSTNPFTYPTLGPAGLGINALAYNPADNYLYALRTQSNAEGRRLYRISATGARTDLGLVSGLPEPTTSAYFAAAFTDAGDNIMYVMTARTASNTIGNTMYRINVVNRTATAFTLSRNIYFADLAYANGLFYAFETSGQLVSIHPTSGVVTNLGSPSPGGTFGAFWADSGGIYGVNNLGGFYRFNRVTGQRTLISDAPPSSGNDGARCPLGPPLTFLADLAITKTDDSATYTPGTNVVYTIVARNNGPFGAQDAQVQDALPAGITTASWTCVAANGAVCRTASGSGAIDARVDLPYNTSGAGATATFTLTMAVPAGFTGDLVNTATVAPGDGNTDPNPANNSATDTDTQSSVSDLSITKTNTADVLVGGQQTTYRIVVSSAGPSTVVDALLQDTPVEGLTDCELAVPACEVVSGTATCPTVGTGAGQLSIDNLFAPLPGGVRIPLVTPGSSIAIGITCTVQ